MRQGHFLTIFLFTLVFISLLPATGATDSPDEGDVMEDAEEAEQLIVQLEPVKKAATSGERKDLVRESRESWLGKVEAEDDIRVLNEFWITNSVLVEVEQDSGHEKLRAADGVRSLNRNAEVEVLASRTSGSQGTVDTASGISYTVQPEPTTSPSTYTTYGVEQINASEVWSRYGTRGDGVKVAVLDSGVNLSHSDLELRTTDPSDPTYPGGWAEFDENGDRVRESEPYYTGNHGTLVTGAVGGEHTGVAPDASLMHALVLDDQSGTIAQVLSGLEWAVENDADVVSISLGGPADPAWIEAVGNANQLGTTVVAAIGNWGSGNTVSPANVYDSIGVGAVDENLEVADYSGGGSVDTVSTWGDSAPDDWPEEYVVPDVVAAGVGVNSTSAYGGYEETSGTSMATPHVSGAAALALSVSGERNPDRVREALSLTAYGSGSEEPDGRYGHGAVDALLGTEHLVDEAFVSGSLVDGSGDAVGDASVTISGMRVDGADGEYEAGLSAGTWEIEASASGYRDTTETVTLNEDEDLELDMVLEEVEPANFVTQINSTNSPLTEGDTLVVDSSVKNTGDTMDTQVIELKTGGAVRDSNLTSIDGGEVRSIQLNWTTETGDSGNYTVRVGSVDTEDTEQITVEPADKENTEANPLLTEDGQPLERGEVEDAILAWVVEGEISGVEYTREQVEGFVLEWVLVKE